MTNASMGLLSTLMVLVGLGIPVMAALNSGLGLRIGSSTLASTILFGLAFVIALTVLSLRTGGAAQPTHVPWYFYLGGLFVALYVLSITAVAPKIGVGNSVFFVLLGQLAASAIIDHFGLLGAPRVGLSTWRAMGLLLMTIGVGLARRPPSIS